MNPSEEIALKQVHQKDESFQSYYKEHYKTFFLLAYEKLQML
jgi:hypothetical protein